MREIISSKGIGWKVRKFRHQAGWTQERLAEQIGVTVQQIQKYEAGINKLNTDRLQQLAMALDVPVQMFFTETDETLPMDVSEKLLIDSYRAISNDGLRESILKIVTTICKKSQSPL